MKISEGMKIIETGWTQKPKGFRVKYQKLENGSLVTDYSPGLDEAPLGSDTTAWRYAWKLFESTKSDNTGIDDNEFVNIIVVDDMDNAIKYYVTNEQKVYNAKS